MATNNLRAESARANDKLHELGLTVQEQARQVTALSHAIDDALDWTTKDEALRDRLGRAASLLQLVRERGDSIADLGEDIERRAGRASATEEV